MAERKDRDPVLGKLDELDEETSIPTGLRAEAKGEDSGDVSVSADDHDPPRVEAVSDAEPAVSVAVGLTTRTRPSETELDASGPGNPGASIRAARDRLGLEVSALAFRTRLPQRVIENLEANRFESMAPAYVRGYLRAVARELDDDADRWIQAYETLGYTELPPRASVQRDLAVGQGSSGGRVWYWIAAVIVLLVLGLGVHAWTDDTRGNPLSGLMDWLSSAEQPSVSDTPSPAPEQGEPSLPEPATEMDWIPDPVPFGTVADPFALEPEAGSASDDPVPEADAAIAPEAAPANGGAPIDTPVASEGATVLTLSFDATSWVEVRSSRDRIEFRGIFHAGDEQTAAVELPARIVLGNAPAVRLERDGEAVDLAPFTREDLTARFSLSAE